MKYSNDLKKILWLKNITQKDVPTVGLKGANLGEMYNIVSVPNGFCLTVNAYDEFLESTNIKEEIFRKLNSFDINTEQLNTISSEIRALIDKQDVSNEIIKNVVENYKLLQNKYVAVRSSSTAEDLVNASFAGQYETYLNVKGENAIIEAIRNCWSSLFTSRAIFYRQKRGFKHEEVKISVIIQEMITSEKSGIISTATPTDQNKEEMIIESSYGLGKSIVSSQVEPDQYIIKKDSFEIININIGSKSIAIVKGENGENINIKTTKKQQDTQLLNTNEIKQLAKTAIKIEQHFKKPQNIEWAIWQEMIYILQARPITGLN